MPPTPLEVRALGAAKLASSVMKVCLAVAVRGNGFDGRGGGGQLFSTEFGKLCVPLKKSWLRPLLAFPVWLSIYFYVLFSSSFF